MAKFQVMPDLAPDEYEALKSDIAKRGIQIPVLIDQAGDIVDGHHRFRIATELGIVCPTELCQAKTDADKRSLAIALNLARRHLTREQREQMWIAMRQDGMSYQEIADADGTVHKTTVMRTVANATVDLPATVTGKDGKKRAASKPRNQRLGDALEDVLGHDDEKPEVTCEVSPEAKQRFAEAVKTYVDVKRMVDGARVNQRAADDQQYLIAYLAMQRAIDAMEKTKTCPTDKRAKELWGAIDGLRDVLIDTQELPHEHSDEGNPQRSDARDRDDKTEPRQTRRTA
jgi:ParB-like chromosome segregation protein Spo0J